MNKTKFEFGKRDPRRDRTLENLAGFIRRLPADKAWTVTVAPFSKERTSPQNKALFGVAYPPLVEATGHTVEELHTVMCERYFGIVEYEVLGQRVTRPYRTTTTDENGKRSVMDRIEFSAFYALVQRVGAGIGVYIPDPEPEIPWHARADSD